MLFTTLDFLVFLAVTLAVFAWLPGGWRFSWLLLASLVFYASFGLANLAFLAVVAAIAWAAGYAIEHSPADRPRRLALAAGLVLVLGGLAFLKFYDFLAAEIENLLPVAPPRLGISAPVGFSFYAFMAAAYMIDVYRGAMVGETRVERVGLYLAWFPKILAGPIERAPEFLRQLPLQLRLDPVLAATGLQLVLWGLVKKVLIADNLAPVVDAAFAIAPYTSPMDLVIAVYFFAFQIYCDFSGYSDIAIGLSLLFGIRLMENFRRPYLAVSSTELWSSRWHVSLGHWFRDYLYIPLGGGQAGTVRRYLNVMLVFLVSGLWHAGLGYGIGWTFLIWGALNGVYQWAGLATRGVWRRLGAAFPDVAGNIAWRILRIVVTFHLILLSWVFFRAESIDQALVVIGRIWKGLPGLPGLLPHYPFSSDHALGAALILLLLAVEILDERRPILDRLALLPRPLRWSAFYAAIFTLVLFGRWQSEQFIYMQF